MLNTARVHFDQDMARARALLAHSGAIHTEVLADDILRAAWMLGVGATDAYFSDAYADLISRALRAKDLQPAIQIPDRLNNLKVPVTAILRQSTGGWRWRMAARELIEKENVLSLEKIKTLFNHFFRNSHRILKQDTIEVWILHPQSRVRLFGVSSSQYRSSNAHVKTQLRIRALEQFEEHFSQIFQRRHDCIHNCDRPRIALQPINSTSVRKTLEDIEFLVSRCHEAFHAEFPVYLNTLGFSAATRNQVCA